MIKHVLLSIVALVAIGCANNVNQNAHTGEDGSFKKAREIQLVNGELTAKGIVTYPGGDRADWKVFEIPDKGTGTIDLKLTWKTPRPGLQLAFDVYDEYGKELSKSSASTRRRAGRSKNETINDVKGKVYVRVYAVGRGDAGAYQLHVEYKENPKPVIFDPNAISVNDPPHLPDIPAIVEPCTNDNFDIKKPECKNFCPDPSSLAPKGWPPCSGPDKCPDPTDIQNLACWKDPKTRPQCSAVNPWDKKFAQWCPAPPCPTPPDPNNPNCKPKPQTGRILAKSINGQYVTITVSVGKAQGITPDWKAVILRQGSQSPLSGGELKFVRVDMKATTLTSSLTMDQLTANDSVLFTPPP